MTAAENHRRLVDELSVVPDPFEVLNTLVARTKKLDPLPGSERLEPFLVHGCQSQLWIVPEHDPDSATWSFRAGSDAPVVLALGHLFSTVFSGATADEIAAFTPTVVDDLNLARVLTQNRQHGARQIVAKIKAYVVG